MDPKELPEYIFDLLSEKKFERLTQKEQADVRQYLTESEYSELQETVALFTDADKLQKEGITHRVGSTKGTLHTLLNYKIPAYQVAAAFVVLLGCFMMLQKTSVNNDPGFRSGVYAENVSLADGNYPEWLVFER